MSVHESGKTRPMRDAHLLIVDTSGGQRGQYEWFVKDAEDGSVVTNGEMTCDGISWEVALDAAEEEDCQVVYAMVLDGGKGDAPTVSLNRLAVTREYYLQPGETRMFMQKDEPVVTP